MAEFQSSSPSDLPQEVSSSQITPRMSLREAAEIIISQKVMRGLKPSSLESARGQMNALVRFFGDIPLRDIQPASPYAYQCERSKVASSDTVNHELALLKKILKRATVITGGVKSNLWEAIEESYKPLQPKQWAPPKTFTVQEQERIFSQAASDPALELANIVFSITRNTTASGLELRGLRLRNLELEADPPRIHVPPDSTKNTTRPRVIPLNEMAVHAFRLAIDRAARMGSHRPEHYLFPFRVNRALWNPNRRASKSWLRKQTERLRRDSDVPHLRPHAFRHLAVTELLESGAPEQTVIALAGWVGRRMIETYSHTRIEAKADAVKLLGPNGGKAVPPPSLPAPAAVDLMNPAIQAEIARQVALALQQHLAASQAPVQATYQRTRKRKADTPRPRLVIFPGGAR